jgi:hypothetical protein
MFSGLFFLLSGCSRENAQGTYYPVPQSLKDECLFSEKSYWIYLNDSTGEQDCTFVSGETIREIKTDFAGNTTEFYTIPLVSGLFTNFALEGYLGALSESKIPGHPFLAGIKKFYFCGNLRTAHVIFNDSLNNHEGKHYEPCSNGIHEQIIYEVDDFKQLGMPSSILVNGHMYDSVFVTRSAFIIPPDAYDTAYFFFKPNIGLIKVIMNVDTSKYQTGKKFTTISWGLLRYNIK